MNAASFNQGEWLCVLRLIHDDDSSPAERWSCWGKKNGAKFASTALLSVKYQKKNHTLLKLQDLSV